MPEVLSGLRIDCQRIGHVTGAGTEVQVNPQVERRRGIDEGL
jgi:hypothetical protein